MRLVLLFVALIAVIPFASHAGKSNPDKFIGNTNVHGKFQNLESGDYLHATIRSDRGNTLSFYVQDEEACYLIRNKSKTLKVDYKKIQRFIPEGGGYFPANIITQITTENSDFRSWRKKLKSKDIKRCQLEVERNL